MLRQIIKSSESLLTLRLPNEMIGKTVEVIAFEIEDAPQIIADKKQRIKAIEAITMGSLVDLTNFKFNRDEANDYSE